jgi:hypothetical protein
MKVSVSKEVLTSINSLAIAVSKDDVHSSIEKIALAKHEDTLVAMATDRYVAVRANYREGVDFDGDWIDGDTILLEPKALKSALDIVKAHKHSVAYIDIEKDGGAGYATILTTRVEMGFQAHKYPAIERLFSFEKEPDGVPYMGINPEFVGKLAKILPPEIRPDRNRVWRLEFRSVDGTDKRGPVYAKYTGLNYELEALVQPALIRG